MMTKERVFTFYIDNRVDSKVTLTEAELTVRFKEWIDQRDKDYLGGLGSIKTVLNFLTGDDGLNSTFEEEEFDELFTLLKAIYIKEVYKGLRRLF